ncbi:hypothetical protein [Methylobacterium nigriterrae]|uniref:hypothetical protein n=1 Tax=Methylobacterium nigriterrae TaxID=3127512 RepID=UPI0030135F2F
MHKATLELLMEMIYGVALDEALADELSRIAEMLQKAGMPREAADVRARTRHHRVKALELRGRIAALGEECICLFDEEADARQLQ